MERIKSPCKEFPVTFTGRLSTVRLAPVNEPLPPFRRPNPPSNPATKPLAAPTSVNFWETAVAQELAADREKILTTLATLRRSLDELRQKQDDQLGGLRNAAVELSLTIAAQLLHRVVTTEEFPVENMVRDMAAQITGETTYSIHLHPDDLKLLEKRLGSEPLLSGAESIRVIPDPNLKRCECRVEGGSGAMLISDAIRQLQEIREELLRNLSNDRNARA